jgi:mannitol/fructose-specific phosphotransferase system IIA component
MRHHAQRIRRIAVHVDTVELPTGIGRRNQEEVDVILKINHAVTEPGVVQQILVFRIQRTGEEL